VKREQTRRYVNEQVYSSHAVYIGYRSTSPFHQRLWATSSFQRNFSLLSWEVYMKQNSTLASRAWQGGLHVYNCLPFLCLPRDAPLTQAARSIDCSSLSLNDVPAVEGSIGQLNERHDRWRVLAYRYNCMIRPVACIIYFTYHTNVIILHVILKIPMI